MEVSLSLVCIEKQSLTISNFPVIIIRINLKNNKTSIDSEIKFDGIELHCYQCFINQTNFNLLNRNHRVGLQL